MNELALLLAATIAAGTTVALAGLGLLLNEKAGVLNLGAEGMMLVAAVAGFATALATGSDLLAFAVGGLAGAVAAAVLAGMRRIGALLAASCPLSDPAPTVEP